MSDLIYKQSAINATWFDPVYKDPLNVLAEVKDRLESLPSVQSNIIHCKDCANWITGYITDQDDFVPPKCGKYQQMVGHSSADYCSLAERK